MNILDRIASSIKDQKQLIRDFYHLDYWDDKSLSEGFAEASGEATAFVEEKLQGRHPLVSASAGAGMGVAKLMGAIPIGLNEWAIQVAKKVPEGPGKTLYKLVEVPVKGLVHGAGAVISNVEDWTDGSLSEKDPFTIANEVTSTIGLVVILVWGGMVCIPIAGGILCEKGCSLEH